LQVLEFRYNVAITTDDEPPILIDWGNQRGWMKEYNDQLERATRLSLIPKNGQAMPTVTVELGPEQRWILFSRVYGQVTGPVRMRCYAIGHQQTVKGVRVKSIMWVYPDGSIEHAEEPSFWREFLNKSA
jgi:hypothetical protein